MEFLGWLEASPPAAFLRQTMLAYILTNATHILGIGLLLGAILPLDLRIIGVLKSGRLDELTPFLIRIAATGLVLAIVTGALLFSVKPAQYVANPAFLAKLALVTLGLLNIGAQHASKGWQMVGQVGSPGVSIRLLAGVSFATWLSALVVGRWIGFV